MIKMKDSRIDWLGEIPAHWEIKRLKSIFSECKETSSTGEEDLLSVSEYYGIARRQDIKEEDEFDTRADSLEGYKVCRKDDLVINIMLAWKRGLGFSDFDGIVSPAYAVYRGKNIVPHYYHYLLRTDRYIAEFKRNSKGIIDSRLRLYTDRFFNIKTIVPPIKEQQDIADYLDRKTAEIDDQISLLEAKQQAYIKLKKSLISEVITNGLNPHLEFKDTGIEWIGKIPVHWDVKRFKAFAKTIKGKAMNLLSEPTEDAKKVLTLEALRQDAAQFYDYVLADDEKQICTPKDIVVIWDGAGVGEFLKAKDGVLSSTIAKIQLTNKSVILPYLWYWRYKIEYRLKSIPTGMGIPHLNPTLLNNFMIAIPPIEEQRAIANYLDKKTEEIDTQINLLEQKIAAYKRLKQSLIDEVVTGKRKIN